MTRERLRELMSYAIAIRDAMRLSMGGDPNNMWRYSSYKEYMRKCNALVKEVEKFINIDSMINIYLLDKVPNSHNTTIIQQKNLFDDVYSNISILVSLLENKVGIKNDEMNNIIYFLQNRLRAAIHDEPKKEIEVQDAVEILLIGKGLLKGTDYDRETGRVKVSVKEVVPDFIFPKLDLALEIKLSKDHGKQKAIVDEINADIKAYGKKYPRQLYIVYDLGTIRDESEFKNDLDNAINISVIIVKH